MRIFCSALKGVVVLTSRLTKRDPGANRALPLGPPDVCSVDTGTLLHCGVPISSSLAPGNLEMGRSL
jgi:hypothetical protein